MPTATSHAAKREKPTPHHLDAIELLEKDHREAKTLFRRYQKLVQAGSGGEERRTLALQICSMLKVHTQIEEEILYPEAREVVPDEGLVKEAIVEYAGAKDLIRQIEDLGPDDELYDAKVKVLGEYIDHHVREEQDELFPKIRRRLSWMANCGRRASAR